MVRLHFSALCQIGWNDYAVRFLFGGLITAVAGLIAKKFGPGVGGLFLAFPAIFPASATLIEKHVSRRSSEPDLMAASEREELPAWTLPARREEAQV